MALGTELRRLGKHSAIYGLGGIVSRVIAVFLLPVYTRFLDTEEFGSVGVLVALFVTSLVTSRLYGRSDM